MFKKCYSCKMVFSVELFYKTNKQNDGTKPEHYSTRCKDCQKHHVTDWKFNKRLKDSRINPEVIV